LGYTAKNFLLDDIEELTLVKGFGKEVLSGDKDHPPLSPHITAFGKGGLNVNTVSEQTLYLLGLSQADVTYILNARKDEGIRVLTQNLLTAGLNRTSTDTFRIEALAILKTRSSLGYNIVSVVRRIPYKGGYKTEILYWKENEYYTGS
ncbi:MAG: hypothetical protein D6778_10520, partial [Nitrospirae bacterium]